MLCETHGLYFVQEGNIKHADSENCVQHTSWLVKWNAIDHLVMMSCFRSEPSASLIWRNDTSGAEHTLLDKHKARLPQQKVQGTMQEASSKITGYLSHAEQHLCVSHAFLLSSEVHNTGLHANGF